MATKRKNKEGVDFDISRAAIDIVRQEKTQWEYAQVWITDRVSFNIRPLIRQCRKNYWGVFNTLVDPVTQREKIWVPLTESVCESIVKNIDLDTKDINVRAKHPKDAAQAIIVRSKLQETLQEMGFGELLDVMERQLVIDGTVVWKTFMGKDETGKTCLDVRQVDLLNVYIDPTAKSIQEAYRFTERALMTPSEVKNQKEWINTKGIVGTVNLSPIDAQLNGMTTGANQNYEMVDVYEMWGYFPKSLITGRLTDKKIEVEGRIIVSGLDNPGKERVHLIEERKPGKRPYQECRYKTVQGSWYGRGAAEMLIVLQEWINTIVNIRVNRSYVSQLGIFKIKRGSNITNQMMRRLVSNGSVMVNTMDDIQQLVVQEAGPTSYQDEETARSWAERITQAFEVATGERLPSSTPATNAAIQSNSAQSTFVMVKEGIGMFLERWLQKNVLPYIKRNIKPGDVIAIAGTVDEVNMLTEQLANNLVMKELEKQSNKNPGIIFDPEQIELERQRILAQLQRNPERYIKLGEDEYDPTGFNVIIDITNEKMDKAVLANNLISALQFAPEYREATIAQIYDLMGLNPYAMKRMQPEMPQMQQPTGNVQPMQSANQVTQQALTL